MPLYRSGLVAGLLALLPAAAPAQETLNPWTVNLFVENDLFADTDLNYTSGVRLSTVSPDLSDFLELRGRSYPWVDRLNQLLEPLHPDPDPDSGGAVVRNVAVSFGQLLFTPQNRYVEELIPDDRPYAAWLYTGMGYHARTADSLHSLEVDIGMVGPAALGRQAQDLIHEIGGWDKWEGWDNQLNNEPGLQIVFERKHRNLLQVGGGSGLAADFITHWGASLGNVATYANAGVEFRLGLNLPDDFGTSTLRPGGDNYAPGAATEGPLRLYGFVAGDGRAVARNLFLDGNTFRDSHSVDSRTLVADLAVGVVLDWQRWRLSYSHVFRTREFEGQDESQKYGALSLSYSFNRD